MQWFVWALGAVACVVASRWLLDLKTGRPDGEHVRKAHPYRRMMGIIMPTRGESVVFFDAQIDATRLLDYVERAREEHEGDDDARCDVTHVVVAAAGHALAAHPRLNRFVAGGRLYQRDGIWASFSMKRHKLDATSKLATVKLQLDEVDGEDLRGLVSRINGHVNRERGDDRTYLDKELDIFLMLPRFALTRAFRLLKWLDSVNLLPGGFIRDDGMFSSVFIANLGSLGMGSAYHHLYEWGNCPLFITVGAIEEVARVVDGEVRAVPVLPLRITFDERIEDGLSARDALREMERALADPLEHLGPAW